MSAKWDATHMRSSSDQQLHTMMLQAVKSRNEDAESESRQSEAEDANDFACRLATELARRKAERADFLGFELAFLGICDKGPVDFGNEAS